MIDVTLPTPWWFRMCRCADTMVPPLARGRFYRIVAYQMRRHLRRGGNRDVAAELAVADGVAAMECPLPGPCGRKWTRGSS